MADIITRSEAETVALGERLGAVLRDGNVLALHGDLGAGKTHFVQGIARGMGITEPVVSPTFTILNYYDHEIPLQHFDFYRLEEASELAALGFDEYVQHGVTVIEWSEKFPECIPHTAAHVYIDNPGLCERKFHFVWQGSQWEAVENEVKNYAIGH